MRYNSQKYVPYKTLSTYSNDPSSQERPSNPDDVAVTSITSLEQKNQIINSHLVTIVDIYADWCGPCKLLEPEYVKLFAKYNSDGVIAIVKENVDLKLSDITAVPTVQYYINGKLEFTTTGADVNEIEKNIINILQQISELTENKKKGGEDEGGESSAK